MRFRDPETGEVFTTIRDVLSAFCNKFNSPCTQCPVAGKDRNCFATIRRDPAKAARKMGYEVIEDENPVCR